MISLIKELLSFVSWSRRFEVAPRKGIQPSSICFLLSMPTPTYPAFIDWLFVSIHCACRKGCFTKFSPCISDSNSMMFKNRPAATSDQILHNIFSPKRIHILGIAFDIIIVFLHMQITSMFLTPFCLLPMISSIYHVTFTIFHIYNYTQCLFT